MGPRIDGDHPGIIGLVEFVEEHGGALEADLIDKGLRIRHIGEKDFTLSDLLAIIQNSPRDSALFRKLHPIESVWSHTDHMLALVFDKLAEHNWMISKDGAKGIRRPKPFPRPGVTDEDSTTKHYTGKAIPMDQMAEKVDREYRHLRAVPDLPEKRGKLTAEQVVAIRKLAAEGHFTREDIALSYEVSESTIGRIVRRETWADLVDTA